jgi:hypothetical protein
MESEEVKTRQIKKLAKLLAQLNKLMVKILESAILVHILTNIIK